MKGAYSDTSDPENIDTALFTHIYYTFLQPDPTTFKLVVSNETGDELSTFSKTLHDKGMKTLISIGGAGDVSSSAIFARMASSPASRNAFIKSTISVARKYIFDGLDLDWEFPKNGVEMIDFGILLGEWRAAIDSEALASGKSHLFLTAAVYYSSEIPWDTPHTYPAESINKNIDWINVMSYDYYGSWDKSKTGAHAALYDPSPDYNKSTRYGLNRWIHAGVSVHKLVMGLSLYARTWNLANPNAHGIGAPANNIGPGNGGTMTFSQVVAFNLRHNATVVHDEQTVSTYSYAGTNWMSYTDEITAVPIIKYAKHLGLLGYFFWAIKGEMDYVVYSEAYKVWNN